MIRILAIDIDGTLITDNGIVSENNKISIDKLNKFGTNIALISGRAPNGINNVLSQISETNIKYVGAFNGALTYKTEPYKKLIDINFKFDQLADLIVSLNVYKDSLYLVSDQIIYTFSKSKYPYKEALKNNQTVKYIENIEQINFNVYKVVVPHISNTQRIERQLKKQFKGEFNITQSGPDTCDIMPILVSKGNALQEICLDLEISIKNSAVIGDSNNDYSMLTICGSPYIVGNATFFLKNQNYNVVSDNNSNGVSKAIDKIIQEYSK